MNEQELANELFALTGQKHHVSLEFGLSVFEMEPYYIQILSISNPPKKISGSWILDKVAKKAKQSEQAKQRRNQAIAMMKEGLKEAGVTGYNTYETQYGFGVCNLFGDGLAKAQEIIEKTGINPKKVEYSKEHWVVRVIL